MANHTLDVRALSRRSLPFTWRWLKEVPGPHWRSTVLSCAQERTGNCVNSSISCHSLLHIQRVRHSQRQAHTCTFYFSPYGLVFGTCSPPWDEAAGHTCPAHSLPPELHCFMAHLRGLLLPPELRSLRVTSFQARAIVRAEKTAYIPSLLPGEEE